MPSKVPEFSVWKQILRILNTVVLLNLKKAWGMPAITAVLYSGYWLQSRAVLCCVSIRSLHWAAFIRLSQRIHGSSVGGHDFIVYTFIVLCVGQNGYLWIKQKSMYYLVIQIKSVFLFKKKIHLIHLEFALFWEHN